MEYEDKLKVNKNIILMNGAKIVKEENTETALAAVTGTMPHMDSVTGYFVPETQDVSNQRWNDYLGGNSIALQNAIQADSKSIGLRKSPKGYGQLTTPEPLTLYAVMKLASSEAADGLCYALCKGVRPSTITRMAFNIISYGNKFNFASGDNDCQINGDLFNYHVMCAVRDGDNAITSSFCDGEYIAQTSFPVKMGTYKGYYTLNEEEYWAGQSPKNDPKDIDYLALIFCSSAHSPEQIKANSDWLYKKYISEEPMPDFPKGLRVYKDIVLMNGAKIYNEDGTEYFN